MMSLRLIQACVLVALCAPAVLLVFLVLPGLFGRSWRESVVGVGTQSCLLVSLGALLAAGASFLAGTHKPVLVRLGQWFSAAGGFRFDLLVDVWSIGFAALAVAICGIVSSFSFRYMHRESGFQRYFVLLVCFVEGVLLVSLAGSIEVLFAGWELLGLSSALLVAFFHDRPAPVENGFRVFAFYRAGDACMLAAAVLLHHWAGTGTLAPLFSGSKTVLARLGPTHAAAIAILLVAAAAAKSALLPFSTWLPRAMEGPTPSSAVYYGAVSIHAGCFLLLRFSLLLHHSPAARVLALAAGSATAFYAALAGRVQTDVKSKLCFASLTQVGIIVVEISLGWNVVAGVHMAGNACLRLLQFLSAPNILHDLHELESDLGERLSHAEEPPTVFRRALYLAALERGFLDGLTDRLLVEPLERLAACLDRLDRWLFRLPLGAAWEDEHGS